MPSQKIKPSSPKSNFLLLLSTLTLLVIIGGIFLGKFLPSRPSDFSNPPVSTVYTEDTRSANWKTYTNEKFAFSFKFPSNWLAGKNNIGADNIIQVSFSIHNLSDKDYVERVWSSTGCGGGNSGCIPGKNLETKILEINGNTVYWKIDDNNQIHAFFPNTLTNKTVELYTLGLKDKDLFTQILSTFHFN